MTREEIREGIAKTLYRFEYDGWERLSAGDRVRWLARADAVMNKEHSQGVVIEVDRELPQHLMEGQIACDKATYQELLRRAGYVAVEPLIKE